MKFPRRLSALCLLAAATTIAALQVAPGSPCAHKCLGSGADNNWSAEASTTNSSEITCSDAAYADTKVGLKYKQCQECLRTSTRGNWGETDAKWFIYNLRFALDVCLFESPEAAHATPESPCASNQGCKNIKAALTGDDLAPTQNLTWSYCFQDDGAFMGSDRTTCMQCLRGTQDQTYMANFLTALEAGCRQTPDEGTAIGLSGTVFTSQHVNITDPEVPPKGEHGSLSTAAIVGIAVGVIVLLLLAVGLLLFYCHKQRTEENWEDYYYDAYAPQQPSRAATTTRRAPVVQVQQQPNLAAKTKPMTEVPKMTYIRTTPRYPDEKTPPLQQRPIVSSGDYYDSIERGLRDSGGSNSYPMKELDPVAAHSTGTLHSAYSGRSISRGRTLHSTARNSPPASSLHRRVDRDHSASTTTSRRGRDPSPPASVHERVRSNTPDSFAVQAYLDAAEESARMAAAASVSSPTASSATSGGGRRRSMLSLLSLPKLGGGSSPSKKEIPAAEFPQRYILQKPLRTTDQAFHGDRNISRPILAKEEPRFTDGHTISGAAPVVSKLPMPPTPRDKYDEYKEVPLKSGKSTLYGM